VAVAVAGMFGGWVLLWSSNDDNSGSETTETTQPLPPARSVARDVPSELIPSYQAGAAVCPRVPWTFYAAMGKLSSDHGRDLAGGRVRVEDRLVQGFVTLAEEHWVRYHRGGSYESPHDTMITTARLLCAGPEPQGVTMEVGLAIRYVSEVPAGRVGSLLAQAAA
jgi:hypothetical protein